jgi:membrane fusion protein, multidrug efflux system
MVAPCDGLITDLQPREGAYFRVGQAALTLIDTRRWLILANFRETSLSRMHEGQPALAAFRGMRAGLFPATVSTIGESGRERVCRPAGP